MRTFKIFLRFLLLALSFSSSSFVCSEFLSAISQKFKQESIEIYFLCFGENIFLLHRYLFAFIVPLFYTEKGNCFSLTRFTQHFFLFSPSRIQIFKCIFLLLVCNLVSFESVFIIHIIHNPRGRKKEVFLQMTMCYHYIKVSHIDNFVACNQNFKQSDGVRSVCVLFLVELLLASSASFSPSSRSSAKSLLVDT